MKRRLAVLVFTVFSLIVLALPQRPVRAVSESADFCTACESDCYTHSSGVRDYNMCVMLCNYAGNCGIPIIQ